ncbi:nuclear transport factor 2 family protein [Marivirga sp. S37H4]|uniref:Nuclear transport factor 2 family protein n=1 Tax=Marivirga aurantiaca TaxID=2802615 RepID=A0A934WUX3_9BACT|nr:nuclear transport factor 2 family protein [Marivirga aurantiaca]MBK6263453.1 nuclear transport factor 2 family protein [Marivirga aurantiaca]
MKHVLILVITLLLATYSFAQNDKDKIDIVMDAWHKAAATANEEVFFGSMTADGIYLGTDKTEKWTRDEMKEWSKKYFERESAWAFTAISRDVYFSENGNTAWFNEKLDTWMGICKGTGILVNQNGEWKIALYDLSVTVDNDKIQEFIELTKE